MILLYYVQVRNLGKPVELAGQYYKDGADEVCPLPFSPKNFHPSGGYYFKSDVVQLFIFLMPL